MLTSRYAPIVLLLLGLAAVPTVIHSYMDSTLGDGRTARGISLRLRGEAGAPTARRADWGEDRVGAVDWTERTYGGTDPVKLFVGRSYDLKKLYHHPELAIDYGGGYTSHSVITLPERPGVPIHLLRGPWSSRRVALYALEYGGGYIADPIWFQLRTSVELLFSRRRPMTMFFAAQDLPRDDSPEASRAAGLLVAAMAEFESQGR